MSPRRKARIHNCLASHAVLTAKRLRVPVFPVRVFEVKPGEMQKMPLVKRWTNGGSVEGADEIRQLFARYPQATHAGIPTGDRSGILAVDLDGADAQKWAKEHPALLPTTRTQPTQRPGGQHLYYRLPPGLGLRNSASQIAPGIDIRADGGFIVDWSSQYAPQGDMAEAPRALLELLKDRDKVKVDFSAANAIPESRRNDSLAIVAGRLRHAGLSFDTINAALQKHNTEHCKPPLKAKEVESIARSIARYSTDAAPPALLGPELARPTRAELTGAPYEAPVIVDGYLLKDAGGFVAPGGTGKSTLILYESIHIILGRPLYGRSIVRPGPTLFVTAEDSRAVVLSRLNWICRPLRLSDAEINKVLQNFYVEDISSTPTRLARVDRSGTVGATEFVDELVAKYANVRLSVVTFDPTSLIGPGETSGNDGMAELMRIARRVVHELSAAVRLVHHVSQNVARGGTTDQYAGRGGTAFADNSRSNHQLKLIRERRFEHEGAEYVIPGEISDAELHDNSVLAIFIHKMSYAKRDATPIILVRNGFAFRDVDIERVEHTPEAHARRDSAAVDAVVLFVRESASHLTKNALATNYWRRLGLARDAVRKAVDEAVAGGRLEYADLPAAERQGSRQRYLKVSEVAT